MKERSDRFVLLSSLVLQWAALAAVLAPFVLYNNLLEWDFPGHSAAIWHQARHLMPAATGWNPYFYAGYPQGIFYPPLSHYVAALLSYLLGVSGAVKCLLALAVLAMPAVFLFFARRWGMSAAQQAACSIGMTAVLFLQGEMFGTWNFGSDIKSTLTVGLFANALSLPLLFSFLSCAGDDRDGAGRWKAAALLLGLLLLLHPYSAMLAAMFWGALLLDRLWKRASGGAPRWANLWLTIGVGVLIGMPWLLPYVRYRGYMNAESISAQLTAPLVLILLNGTVLAVSLLRDARLRPLALAYLLFVNFILVGTIWKLDVEFTRLTIYPLFLLPAFLISWIRSRPALLAVSALAAVVGLLSVRYWRFSPAGVSDFPLPDFGRVEGRILSVAPPSHLPSYHVNHDLIPLRTGNAASLGLFIQASLNGRFVADIARGLEPSTYIWGTPTEAPGPSILGSEYPRYMRDRLRLFDIRYIYTDLRLEQILEPSLAQGKRYINSYPAPKNISPAELVELKSRYNTHDEFVDFYLYPLGPGALAETLSYIPKAPGTDWKVTCRYWFLQTPGVPVFTERPIPSSVRPARPTESVDVAEISAMSDRIVLEIRADQDVPVLVRSGYFPTWRARSSDGPLEVFRASPNLMVVCGHGRVVLEYGRSFEEYLGLALAVAGLALLIILRP